MEIINFWILKLVLTWIISTVECNAVDKSKRGIQNEISNNAEFFRDDGSPITHMEFGEEKRSRRYSDFDRGYDEFLRNYNNENGGGIERRGRYQVKESDESESAESSSTSDDEDDGESESSESEENRKKYKTKPQKSNGKNKKADQKKTKHCKTEKRGNMLCNICYNPKNDEKAESCSYNSDPSEKNYEYSEDSSYSTKDRKPESLEDGDNDESDENPPKKKRPPVKQVNRYPANHHHHSQHGQRLYPQQPTYTPRQHPNQNYGPQTFIPQAFQPISLRPTGNRPIRIQIKNSPSPLSAPVALIRYRTVETPFGSQHIRLITYPSGPAPPFPPQNHQNRPPQYYNNNNNNNNRRPVSAAQEMRPPRDINGAHSESLLSNVTKEHLFEYLPNHSPNGGNREFAAFITKDWSRCRKMIENNQVCFECYVEGERRKECMFANVRPDNFYKSYSTSKKFNHNHPYVYDVPTLSVSKHTKHSQHKQTKSQSKHGNGNGNKNKDYSAEQFDENSDSDEHFNADLKSPKQPNHANDWGFHHNDKQERPQAQPLRASVSDIVYGKSRPGPEPLALFFQTDPTIFNGIGNNANNTNIDLNTSTNSTKST